MISKSGLRNWCMRFKWNAKWMERCICILLVSLNVILAFQSKLLHLQLYGLVSHFHCLDSVLESWNCIWASQPLLFCIYSEDYYPILFVLYCRVFSTQFSAISKKKTEFCPQPYIRKFGPPYYLHRPVTICLSLSIFISTYLSMDILYLYSGAYFSK